MSITSAIEYFQGSIKNLKHVYEQSKSFWKDEASEQLREITLERIEGPHNVLLEEMKHLEKLVSTVRKQVK